MGEKSGSLWLIVVVVVVVMAVLAILAIAFPNAIDNVMDMFDNTLDKVGPSDITPGPSSES